jgi:hypothetical protein
MARDVVSLERDRVREVTVAPADGKPFVLVKASPGAGEFALAEVPPDDKVKSPYELNSIAGALALLLLDDVLPAKDLKADAKLLRTLRYKSFDGLVVELALYEADGKKWAKVTASYDGSGIEPTAPAPAKSGTDKDEAGKGKAAEVGAKAAAADKPKLKSADEVKKEVDAINGRVKHWVYGLASSDLVNLEKKFADLIEPKAKPKS